ncbi:MAG TPA: aminopeptidase, partial [Anaerolineae bacterium]|nr:aminopeptidase [Anaerolineae bacterium]
MSDHSGFENLLLKDRSMTEINTIRTQYESYQAMGLELNMKRGQPSDADFNLSLPLLSAVDSEDFITDSGIDIRNYPGGVAGLPEAREIFCKQLGVQPSEIFLGNNASLDLMGKVLSWAMLRGVHGSERGWVTQSPKLIVTVPGYDRHFKLALGLGFELVTVAITPEGPDIAAVEKLVAEDAAIKGIFFVPTYSNPTGDSISQAVAERLVRMPTAAADFTIFADDAYAVHHLVENPEPQPNLLALAKAAGKAERVILFGSTSKITFASGGIGFMGMSETNMAYWSRLIGLQTIGPNKVEQWRHVRFLRAYPGGLAGLMKAHAAIIKPKFDAVQAVLSRELAGSGLANWSKPKGG